MAGGAPFFVDFDVVKTHAITRWPGMHLADSVGLVAGCAQAFSQLWAFREWLQIPILKHVDAEWITVRSSECAAPGSTLGIRSWSYENLPFAASSSMCGVCKQWFGGHYSQGNQPVADRRNYIHR